MDEIELFFEFFSRLSRLQLFLLALVAVALWIIPGYLVRKARREAAAERRSLDDDWNSPWPFPRQLKKRDKLLIVGSYICALMSMVAMVLLD